MSNYRSMIDEALQSARARLDGGSDELMKTASAAPQDFLVKEASELADALEYVAHSATGTGSAADHIRGEMVRSFFKNAAAGSPAQGPTTTSGTQAQAPAGGKRRIAINNASGPSPAQSSTQPEAKDGEKPLLESFKQAEGQSLYDILMASKVAGKGGPAEHDAESFAGVSSANENANYKRILHSNEGPVNVTRREAKAPVRKRLAEAFASTGDTTGDAAVSAMFPIGAGKGTHKLATADLLEALYKEASLEGISPFDLLVKLAGKKKQRRKRRAQVMNMQNKASAEAQIRRGVSPDKVSLPHNQSQINRLAEGKGGTVASKAKPASPLSLKTPAGAKTVESLEPTARIKKKQAYMAARERRLGRNAARKQKRYEQKRSRKARIMERRQQRQRQQAVKGPTAKAPSLGQVMAPRKTVPGRVPTQEAVSKMPKAIQQTTAPQQVSNAQVRAAGGTPVAPGQKRTAYTPAQVKERRVTLNNQQRAAKGVAPKPGGTTTPLLQQNMKDKVKASRRRSVGGGGGGAPRPKPSAGGLKRFMTARNLGAAGAAAGLIGGGAYLLNKRRQERENA